MGLMTSAERQQRQLASQARPKSPTHPYWFDVKSGSTSIATVSLCVGIIFIACAGAGTTSGSNGAASIGLARYDATGESTPLTPSLRRDDALCPPKGSRP